MTDNDRAAEALARALNEAALRVDPSEVDWELAAEWVKRDAIRTASAMLAHPFSDADAAAIAAAVLGPRPGVLAGALHDQYCEFGSVAHEIDRIDAAAIIAALREAGDAGEGVA